MKAEGLTFDVLLTSRLSRAIKTMWLATEQMGLMWLPAHKHWRLNERHYGALQGSNKAEAVKKYGETQVKQWRRGYATSPPRVERNSPDFPGADTRSAGGPHSALQRGMSLKDVLSRQMQHWNTDSLPTYERAEHRVLAAQ